ncbi:MAG: hypothetical protein A2297_05310 [Elusimicrobia bacterium RIFOXYB2_FULL_48_7]|nr:MAG: hypothetical protein A2297_05310 [Elusimicrobia bacterium RIFOXYB2_FULL_48_7]
MIKALILGFLSFFLFLVGHIIVFNVKPAIEERFVVIKNYFLIFTVFYVVMYLIVRENIIVLIPADPSVTSQAAINISRAINFMTGYLLYVFLWMGYCQFYFFIVRTISGRMLIEIDNGPGARLTKDELKARYSPEEVFHKRLNHMLGSACIIEKDGIYQNTRKGHYIGNISRFIKEFLKLEPGG